MRISDWSSDVCSSDLIFTSRPAGPAMVTTIWTASSTWTLTALPLFIWMGEILFRTRLSQDLFRGLSPWLGRLPGGLLHVNVAGCTLFAAISGSSARSEEHTSELQSLMRSSYAVFCLKKKTTQYKPH